MHGKHSRILFNFYNHRGLCDWTWGGDGGGPARLFGSQVYILDRSHHPHTQGHKTPDLDRNRTRGFWAFAFLSSAQLCVTCPYSTRESFGFEWTFFEFFGESVFVGTRKEGRAEKTFTKILAKKDHSELPLFFCGVVGVTRTLCCADCESDIKRAVRANGFLFCVLFL